MAFGRLLRALVCAIYLVTMASAQGGPAIINPTTAAASATPIPSGGAGYTYAGCYNETSGIPGAGGARALAGGDSNSTTSNTMTIDECLQFCGSQQYAGLEYGRECYCSPYLSVLSAQLNASECNFACNGNASEICGGTLKITLYNRTETAKSAGGILVLDSATIYGTAALVTLVIAALL